MFFSELNPGFAFAIAVAILWFIVVLALRVIESIGTRRAVVRTQALLDACSEALRQPQHEPESSRDRDDL